MGTVDPRLPKVPKTGPFASDRLDSWKDIARYLNRDVRTVQRWEETGGLPVYRRTEGRVRGAVFAYKSELDEWLRQSPPPPNGKEEQPARGATPRWRTWRVLWVAVPVLILAAGGLVWRLARPKPAAPPIRVVPLTRYAGEERMPAFSPDGRQIAFAWNGKNQDNYDIYWKSVNNVGEPMRLTTDPAVDNYPAWSPDGSLIAFCRWVRGSAKTEALTVPVSGGTERRIYGSTLPSQPRTNYFPALCWTPDGKWIIGAGDAPGGIALHSVETLEVRPLTVPIAQSAGDCCPAIAPNGKRLAFLRASTGGGNFNLFVVRLSPDYRPLGEPWQLTRTDGTVRVGNPMWTGDSSEVLHTAVSKEGVRTLWRVPYDGSRPASQIEFAGRVGTFWAISLRGDRLAYQDAVMEQHILRVDLEGGMSVSRILPSSGSEFYPEVAPDGKRIAFVSRRGHGLRVYISDSDGSRLTEIAPAVGMFPGPARWSPKGDQLVFECQNQGNDDICTVPAGGGAVRPVTRSPARDFLPSWSHDGKWIYFTSDRSGSPQVWKMPPDGTEADAVQLTKGGGRGPVESPDGKTVYFSPLGMPGVIFKIPRNGGEESPAGDFRVLGSQSQNFAVRKDGIYYLSSSDSERWFELWFYRFSTGKSGLIRRIDQTFGDGLSVAPDGRWLLLTASEGRSGDLYMVEIFR
jgi:Tol biopolymer transport system component